MNKKTTLTFAAVMILAALAGWYFGWQRQDSGKEGNAAVATLFSQKFDDALGQHYQLSNYKGEVLVVNFWATWCAPCVKEIPELSRLQVETSGQHVQFLGIGIDSQANIADFQKKLNPGYPLLVAGAGASELLQSFGDAAGGLPYTVVVDKKGVVRATKVGAVDIEELRQWIRSATGT